MVRAYRTKRDQNEVPLVYVPHALRETITEWYHYTLKHPRYDRLLQTMRIHFNWPGMAKALEHYCKAYDVCQRFKITGNKKNGKIPLAEDWKKYSP